jgi:hypothetical protein
MTLKICLLVGVIICVHVLKYVYKTIWLNHNLTHLIKQVKHFNLNPLNLYWVSVEFADHVKIVCHYVMSLVGFGLKHKYKTR